MANQPADDLLTIKEAAEILKVSTVTINRYLKSGKGRNGHCGMQQPSRATHLRIGGCRRALSSRWQTQETPWPG